MKRKLWLCLLCCGLLLTMAAQAGKSYRAERFDVDVQVQADGLLRVDETVTFNFIGGPFSFVFRELPTDHTDGIAGIQAGVDGAPWPNGDGPGEVEITGSNPINVTWHLSPTSDVTRTFDLTYDLLGVVRRGEEADVLNFQALPDEYEYAIDSSRVTVHFPPGGQLIGEPDVRAGDATVITESDRVTFEMQNLSPGDPLVVRLAFAPGAFTSAPPAWQAEQESRNSLAWIWFVLGAIILGGGTLAFWRAGRPYLRTVPKATSYLYKPPLELPPALAGFLTNHSINWNHGLATLFDLAARGFVAIDQVREKSLFRSAEFTLTRLEQPAELRPHEQALMGLLFTDKKGERDVIKLSEMGQLITSSRWKEYTDALKQEADQEGLTDPSARQRQKRLIIWGTLAALLAMPLFIAAYLLSDLFGMWTLITVGAVSIAGIIGLIIAASLSLLSNKGYEYATAFEPFRRLLTDVAKGKTDLPDPTYYHAYLPYATAYGQAVPWVKNQSKSDYQAVPEYFRAAEATNSAAMAAFIVVISTASSSGGSAGAAAGAAGAGAAGGGASGAG